MARMIPDVFDKNNNTSPGEEEVFDTLQKSSKIDLWAVLHSLDIPEHIRQRKGETDFLVLVPDFGIVVLEVKADKDISIGKDGMWEYKNKSKDMGPFKQGNKNIESIRKKLIEKYPNTFKRKIPFCYGVIFTHWPGDCQSFERPRWMFANSKDLKGDNNEIKENALINFIKNLVIENRKLIKNTDFDKKYFGEKEVDLTLKCLRPAFEFYYSPADRAQKKDEEIKQFTEKQFHIIDTFIFKNKQTLLIGSAGTGKTLIAIETARRLASEGKQVLFVCYNELIGRWLSDIFYNEKNITFERITKLMMYYSGISRDQIYGDVNLIFEKLPKEAIENLNKSPIKEADKYDFLIIDEVQDFTKDDFFYFLEKLCKKGLDCNMHLFGDIKEQQVYRSTQDIVKILSENMGFKLSVYETKENCRNPKKIGERIEYYCNLPHEELYTKYLREEGRSPSIKIYDSEASQELQVKKILEELLKDGFFKDEIQFLTFNQNDADLWYSKIANMSITKTFKKLDRFGKLLDFSVETVRRFKGLDKKIIIILSFNHIDGKDNKTLLYIGVSRALSRVYILMQQETANKFIKQISNQLKSEK